MSNQEQCEAQAVDILKTHTPDVYAGPDITRECMDRMLNPTEELVYLEPEPDSDRRVVVAKLNRIELVREISRELIPLCYVIGSTSCNSRMQVVAKWYCVTQ